MPGFVAAQLLLQLAVPLALIGQLAFGRERDTLGWALDAGLAASYVVAITLSGPWLALPWSLSLVYLVLLAGAGALGRRRAIAGPKERAGRRAVVGHALRVGLFTVLTGLCVVALAGRRPFEEPAIDLAFPLGNGTWLVASGGSTALVNSHLKTRTGDRYRAYRGQTYAVDLVKQGGWGSRVSSLLPDGPAGYAAFGEPIHAPCSGTVEQAVDGRADIATTPVERGELAGNHVILECGGDWIVLAHLMRGSVRVPPGSRVRVGDVIGLVGNSGRSDEPHLHIHAQTAGTAEAPLSGAPIPITFDGRHLVRSDRVHERRDSATKRSSASGFTRDSFYPKDG
jgi:hypothetical protein